MCQQLSQHLMLYDIEYPLAVHKDRAKPTVSMCTLQSYNKPLLRPQSADKDL